MNKKSGTAASSGPPASEFTHKNPEIWFLIRATLLVVTILCAAKAIGWFFLFIFLFALPFWLIVFAVHHWRMSDAGFFAAIWQYAVKHLDIIGLPRVIDKETYHQSAWVTYTLILLNEIIYYHNAFPGYWEIVDANFVFLPLAPTWWNVPVSLVTSIFLHGSDAHLWGNMLFLWAVGTTLERRIGWKLFLGGYLLSGIFANLLALNIYYYFMETEMHSLGASGAIAGTMGMFAVRCYFKEMIFPIPVFGVFFLSYKVRLNSLTLIGLFFAQDLLAGVGQLGGEGGDYVNHWAHLGGMYAGALIASLRKVEREAVLERSEDLALSVLSGTNLSSVAFEQGVGIDEAEARVRELLQHKPNDMILSLHLARLITITRNERPEEARMLYRRVLRQLVIKEPERAVEIFIEYYEKYLDIADGVTQFRIAALLEERGNLYHAALTLEMISRQEETPELLRAKALYRSAALHNQQGLTEASCQLFTEVRERFPTSEWVQRIPAWVERESKRVAENGQWPLAATAILPRGKAGCLGAAIHS